MALLEPASVPEDTQLALRMQNEDEKALDCLMSKYGTWVLRVGMRMLGNIEDTEDIRQEIFFKVWEKKDKWDPNGGTFHGWFKQVARNTIIDKIRKRKGTQKSSINLSLNKTEMGSSLNEAMVDKKTPMPDEQLERKEFRRLLNEALAEIENENYKRAWIYRHLEDRTVAETAELLGCKLNTAKIWIYRCNLQLRQILLRKGFVI